ncbi:hypothetical protein [Sphingobium scionense]|uniref:Uncharacterized protein n=1 Tax=Sphingobium scionense TaxID=1404341 RepID=A0A7W6PU35_9SPHN|nr:hypothetical protein [Sphingobium scionense]MBB4147955.1 hypothetical protein [Sphingobium scionense]
MSNATHTPGPFVVGQSENQRQHGGQWGIGLGSYPDGGVRGFGDIGDDRPYMLITGICSEADAHRFAAAPELLSELIDLRRRFHNACRAAGSDEEFVSGSTPGADAAIAKAKGGAA